MLVNCYFLLCILYAWMVCVVLSCAISVPTNKISPSRLQNMRESKITAVAVANGNTPPSEQITKKLLSGTVTDEETTLTRLRSWTTLFLISMGTFGGCMIGATTGAVFPVVGTMFGCVAGGSVAGLGVTGIVAAGQS